MRKLPQKGATDATHREELLHRVERITELPLLVLAFAMIPLLLGPIFWELMERKAMLTAGIFTWKV